MPQKPKSVEVEAPVQWCGGVVVWSGAVAAVADTQSAVGAALSRNM